MQHLKIAILILAHKNVDQLNLLCEHLSQDFDVYVHIDVSSDLKFFELDKFDRVYVERKFRCAWGSPSLVDATVHLMSTAESAKGPYDRHVLISGQDVPMWTNSRLTRFFADNRETDFINSRPLLTDDPKTERISRYHLTRPGTSNLLLTIMDRAANYILLNLQRALGFSRRLDYKFFTGGQWMDLTGDSVRKLLAMLDLDPSFRSAFKASDCADEIFFQTALSAIHGSKWKRKSYLRYVDWESGPEYPRILRSPDLQFAEASGLPFARKADVKVDEEFVSRAYARLEED